MNWIELNSIEQVKLIKEKSAEKAQVIFKHSTRCGVSGIAKNRLERSEPIPGADFYFLDLIRYRSVSDAVSEIFSVYHESPQVLVIRNGECIYDESHSGINMDDIAEQAA
jgi:bacillithiol system protein YtxJ